jgi:hypothetical protein
MTENPSATPRNVTEEPPARSPMRHRDCSKGETKILSIDLGSSSSAAVVHENARFESWSLAANQEQTLRRGLVDLLRQEWLRAAAEDIVAAADQTIDAWAQDSHRPEPIGDVAAMLARLRTGDASTAPTQVAERRAVCLAIEEVLGRNEHRHVRDAALPLLHRLYHEVFDTLPLEREKLWPVPLSDDTDATHVSSMLVLPGADVSKATLAESLHQAFGAQDGALVFPGIKRNLLSDSAVPPLHGIPHGWDANGDVLLAAAYHDIVRRFEAEIDRTATAGSRLPGLPNLQGRSMAKVAITFPTTLPPSARRRLRHLVRDSLGLGFDHNVIMDYDEAVAAAIFFVLRAFGGDRRAGVEAFHNRSQPVPGASQPTRRQHMLVIDVGGGTTDIALLQLDLIDVTARRPATTEPGPAAVTTEVDGRSYVLRPRLLGTTGDPQLGGDLLTLRMFYWLRAALADGIRGTDPASEGSLSRRTLASRQPDPVPATVRDVLRAEFPTHYAQTPTAAPGVLRPRTAVFDQLWIIAESEKMLPGSGDLRFTLKDSHLTKLRPSEQHNWLSELPRLVGDERVTLTNAQFGQLVRPVFETVSMLATDLVHRRLGGLPGVSLDVVALSGRTAQMTEFTSTVLEVFDRELSTPTDGRPPVAWDRTGVVVETRFAKQAASVGAAWAESNRGMAGERETYLGYGVDDVDVKVGQMQVTVPADFGLAGASQQPVPWILAGQPFDMIDQTDPAEEPTRFTRTGWRRLDPVISLHRILANHASIEWGTFRYQSHRDSEGYAHGGLPTDQHLWFQIELTQDLTPHMLICRGTDEGVRPRLHPFYGHDLDSGDYVSLSDVPELAAYFHGSSLASVPRIEAVPVLATVGSVDPVTVFAGGVAERAFQYVICADGRPPEFHARASLYTPAWEQTPGAVSTSSLPGRPAKVRYQFRADLGDRLVDIGDPVEPPRFDGLPEGTECWAVLDLTGRIRLHAGFPPYLDQAATLAEMEERDGSVYRAPMAKGLSLWNPQWDPFTGDH